MYWVIPCSLFYRLATSFINVYLIEMELSTDEFLESIGSFGRYQILLTVFANVAYMLWWGMPTMVMLFIAAEPGWKCKNNATCPFTETIRLGDDNYSYRCDIPREDWEFGEDFTSVVTEVKYKYENECLFSVFAQYFPLPQNHFTPSKYKKGQQY